MTVALEPTESTQKKRPNPKKLEVFMEHIKQVFAEVAGVPRYDLLYLDVGLAIDDLFLESSDPLSSSRQNSTPYQYSKLG